MSENSNQFLDALKQMQGVEVGDIVDVEVLDIEDGQIDVGVENAGVEGVITRREYTSDRNADLRSLWSRSPMAKKTPVDSTKETKAMMIMVKQDDHSNSGTPK